MSQPDSKPLDEAGRYLYVRELGSGAFGAVVAARPVSGKDGELVAVKRLARSHLHKLVESELLNHSQLRHPHVVQLREVYLSPRYVNIVMEYASGGSLYKYLREQKRLDEAMARWIFQQIILAVDYCHRKGVGHRDLKLENTLLEMVPGLPRPLVKICDFGYSKHDSRSVARSKVGTLLYMAPEVMHNTQGSYNAKAADIWSCGVLLYTMLTGSYPFTLAEPADPGQVPLLVVEMFKRMQRQDFEIKPDLGISGPCQALLRRLLHPDAAQRIHMVGIMQHPWFQEGLPPEALTMNAKYLGRGRGCKQSEEEIRLIVQQALRDPG